MIAALGVIIVAMLLGLIVYLVDVVRALKLRLHGIEASVDFLRDELREAIDRIYPEIPEEIIYGEDREDEEQQKHLNVLYEKHLIQGDSEEFQQDMLGHWKQIEELKQRAQV